MLRLRTERRREVNEDEEEVPRSRSQLQTALTLEQLLTELHHLPAAAFGADSGLGDARTQT